MREKVASQLELVRLDSIQPQVMDCPVKVLYLPQVPDKLGQEKSQCFCCERDFVEPFACRWMHLIGNTKGSTGGMGFQCRSKYNSGLPFLPQNHEDRLPHRSQKGDGRGARAPASKVMEEMRGYLGESDRRSFQSQDFCYTDLYAPGDDCASCCSVSHQHSIH